MLGKLKKRKRLRTHGYLKRSSTDNGLNVLKNRRRKGRWELVPTVKKRFQDVKGKAKLHIIAGGTARKSPFDGKGNYTTTSK